MSLSNRFTCLLALLSLVIPSCLFSYLDQYLEPQDVSATEGLPSSLVAGAVSAISGEFTDCATDIFLQGPEPLVVNRVYTSFCREKPWAFNHGELLILGDVLYKEAPSLIIALRQSSGAQLDYICKKTAGMEKLKKLPFKLVSPKGVMHGASAVSGQTNLKNQRVFLDVKSDCIIAESGGGDKKYFKRSGGRTEEGWPLCRQISEEKASGGVIVYEGLGKGVIKAQTIRCLSRKSGQEYSSIKLFEKQTGKHEVVQKMTTSDGRQYAFFFHHHSYKVKEKGRTSERIYPVNRFYLSRVDHPHAPKEEYQYAQKSIGKDLQLIEKSRKGGKRFLQVEYYHEGLNAVGGEVGDLFLKDSEDFRLDRVKKLKAPVGPSDTPIVTHRFDYHAEKKEGKIATILQGA